MITVLGSINMDLIATTDRLPIPGETVAGNGFQTAAGGKGANQALAARRAGAQVTMCGAIGTDQFANPATSPLKIAGAALERVRTVEGPTGTALILVGADGENMIAVVAGANGKVTPDDAIAAIEEMAEGDILLLQFEIPATTIETALQLAAEKGIKTIVNTAPITSETARLSGMADMVVANETEFDLVSGGNSTDNAARIEELRSIHDRTGQTWIITLGADGVVAMHDGGLIKANGLRIEPVDTVGAGDTFCGYLAAGLDAGLSLEDSLERAAVAGSLACLVAGAQPSIPTATDVDMVLLK